MPYFDAVGFHAKNKVLWGLHDIIEQLACSIEQLGLKPEKVRPRIFKPGDIIEKNPGEYPTITVLELFTKGLNGVERTPKILKEFCGVLDRDLLEFVNSNTFIVRPRKITLIIYMVDRAKYEYHCCDIPPATGR